MRRAYHAMRSGKAGPVLIEVPDEVVRGGIQRHARLHGRSPVQRAAPDPDAVKTAVEMLLAAKHPLLWAGQGVHYAEAGDRLAALAELMPAPVVATNPGKSAIPDSHPLALGGATRSRSKMFADFMNKSDLIHGDRLEPDDHQFRTRPCRPARRSFIPPTTPATSTRNIAPTTPWSAMPALVIDALIAEVVKAEGPGRRQRARLAQGGSRRRQEGLARRMGEVPRFRRDAAQPVSRHPRHDAHASTATTSSSPTIPAARASR